MLDNIPKLSALIITYNQEDVIKRAIDSLIAQKDYIYEICVSDDCSTDSTWSILQDYYNKYPGLFKLNRNDPNVMMFENNEKVWTMPTGDIIYGLAGDDAVGEGWFKVVMEYITANHIDYKNELFCIYGDYKAVYPNGDSYIHKNDSVLWGIDPLKLSIRGLLGNRSAVWSCTLLHKFQKVSQGRSYIAETSQDRQLQVFAQKNYYIPHVGNIYYSGIGVSANMTGERKLTNMQRWDYLIENLKKWGIELDAKDKTFIEYKKAREKKDRWTALGCFLKSIDLGLGIKGLQLRRFIFAIIRRIPHKKPIKDFRV